MVIFRTTHFAKDWAESSIITLVAALGKYKEGGAKILKANGVTNMKLDESFDLRSFFTRWKMHAPNLKIIY
jgi:hypothetical protein